MKCVEKKDFTLLSKMNALKKFSQQTFVNLNDNHKASNGLKAFFLRH